MSMLYRDIGGAKGWPSEREPPLIFSFDMSMSPVTKRRGWLRQRREMGMLYRDTGAATGWPRERDPHLAYKRYCYA